MTQKLLSHPRKGNEYLCNKSNFVEFFLISLNVLRVETFNEVEP